MDGPKPCISFGKRTLWVHMPPLGCQKSWGILITFAHGRPHAMHILWKTYTLVTRPPSECQNLAPMLQNSVPMPQNSFLMPQNHSSDASEFSFDVPELISDASELSSVASEPGSEGSEHGSDAHFGYLGPPLVSKSPQVFSLISHMDGPKP